jgi:hypothetical protein
LTGDEGRQPDGPDKIVKFHFRRGGEPPARMLFSTHDSVAPVLLKEPFRDEGWGNFLPIWLDSPRPSGVVYR